MKPALALITCAIAATVALTTIAASTAHACKCPRVAPNGAAVTRSDVVFWGKITDIKYENERIPTHPTAVVIAVDQVYKGDVPATVRLELGRTSCAITWMKQGDAWVVFGRRDETGAITTRQCTGTNRLARKGAPLSRKARGWLGRLGEGHPPKRE